MYCTSVILLRLALRPFTVSNGMAIPAGTTVGVPVSVIHTDGEIHRSPKAFDGFRFPNFGSAVEMA